MRQSLLLLPAFLLLTLTACAQNRQKVDSLIFAAIHGETPDETYQVAILLPMNYFIDTLKTYPVHYVLDGGSQVLHTADRVFSLASSGLIPESIVVGVNTPKGKRDLYLTPPFMPVAVADPASVKGAADVFLHQLEHRIIPYVEERYRASEVRTLSGHSRGGLFVLYSLMQRPMLIRGRFAHSTPAWRYDNLLIRELTDSLKSSPPNSPSFLFLSAGEQENENILQAHQTMQKLLSHIPNLTLKTHIGPHANHQQNPVMSTAPGLLEWGKFLIE